MAKSTSTWILFAVICLQAHQLPSVSAQGEEYSFEVLFQSYRNPNRITSNGMRCCHRPRCNSDCQNVFTFCLRPHQFDRTDLTSCPLGEESFRINKDELEIAAGEPIATSLITDSEITNPILLQGQTPWPGGFQLLVSINHERELVDRFFIEDEILTTVSEAQDPESLNGVFGVSQLNISYRLQCGENYVGPNCETFCVPMDDDSSGHFTCEPDGVKCLDGYADDLETSLGGVRCTSCVPLQGCDPNQGFCKQPGECQCLPGFSGQFCEIEIAGAPIDSTPQTDEEMATTNPKVKRVNEQTSGLSSGGVAGVVLTVLLVIILLGVGGATCGFFMWRRQPWKNMDRYKISNLRKKQSAKDALDNLTYSPECAVEMNSNQMSSSNSRVSNGNGHMSTVISSSPARQNGAGYENYTFHSQQSVDDSNPLYSSNILQREVAMETSNDFEDQQTIVQMLQAQTRREVAMETSNDFEDQQTIDQMLQAQTRSLQRNSKFNNKRFASKSVSQSLENLSKCTNGQPTTPSKMNPYGNYGNETIQRVASNVSLDKIDKDPRSNGAAANGVNAGLFDNPDYGFVGIHVGQQNDATLGNNGDAV